MKKLLALVDDEEHKLCDGVCEIQRFKGFKDWECSGNDVEKTSKVSHESE